MQTNLKKDTVWPSLEKTRYNIEATADTFLEIYNKYDPNVSVAVQINRDNPRIVKNIPLRNFTKDFQEMYRTKFFKKIFFAERQVTALSIHDTLFVPKISNDF